jgi:hypothetical protein
VEFTRKSWKKRQRLSDSQKNLKPFYLPFYDEKLELCVGRCFAIISRSSFANFLVGNWKIAAQIRCQRSSQADDGPEFWRSRDQVEEANIFI